MYPSHLSSLQSRLYRVEFIDPRLNETVTIRSIYVRTYIHTYIYVLLEI